MKEIENIFSSNHLEKTPLCPNPKIPIIIDTREKQSLIAANLIEQKANTKFEKLEIGDYLIGETCIERKTFSDFLSSMISKRLQYQLINMKKYENNFLILEGFCYNYNEFNIHENAIRGMILSIINDFKISIIYTKNEIDTSKFLIGLARKKEKLPKEYSIRQNKTQKTIQERKQFVLEGFPEIGPSTAKTLLIEFGSLRKIFNTLPEELEKIKLDKSQIKNFFSLLNDE